jgi:hypothetical protein
LRNTFDDLMYILLAGLRPTLPPAEWRGPRDLQKQLALDEAKGGAGSPAKKLELKDPRYPPEDGWIKKSYTRTLSDGRKIEIHYVENTRTATREDFKFVDQKVRRIQELRKGQAQ